MRVVLFEDELCDDLGPANLMRATFFLRAGALSALRLARTLGSSVGFIVRQHLRQVTARALGEAATPDGPTLFLNARIVPRLSALKELRALSERDAPAVRTVGEALAAAWMPQGAALPEGAGPDRITELLRAGQGADEECGLELMRYPHDLVRSHMAIFPENLEGIIAAGNYSEVTAGIWTAGTVSVADSAVLDAREGPIVLEDGVQVGEFAYVAGPAYLGAKTRLIDHAAVKDGVALSEVCKVGGEVECSTFMPYSNKQHHGFIGHSFIGSWVNMGAGTSNSDLKNTYGVVRVEHRGERIETGMQFLGCVIGDFSKTAINTSIFTGKFIGAASMIYGFVTRNVPSFCNWARSFGEVTECPPEQVAVTQKRMFERRGVEQSEADVQLLQSVFELTRHERLITSEPPQL